MKKNLIISLFLILSSFVLNAQNNRNSIQKSSIVNLGDKCHLDNIQRLLIKYDNDYVIVFKNNSSTVLMSNDVIKTHDTIADLFENGYVYGNNGRYYFCDYNCSEAFDSCNIVYCSPLKTTLYEDKDINVSFGDKNHNIHLNKGSDVFALSNNHYYFLYKTHLMQNTVLIVDGCGYELNCVCEQIRFKYSANCNHWIACYNDCLMIDGAEYQIKCTTIRDFFINNFGDFAFISDNETDSKTTSYMYIDGIKFLDNIDLFSLQLSIGNKWIYRYKTNDSFFESKGYVLNNYTGKSTYLSYKEIYENAMYLFPPSSCIEVTF